MKGLNVLITGGLGFIGSNLAAQCHQLGANITIFDSLDRRAGGNLFNIADIKDSIILLKKSILNFREIADAVKSKDLIFNCAASTSHSLSMHIPLFDVDVNCKGMINLLEAIRLFNQNARLVHIGTSTQLGRLIYQPANENHPEFPTDIYSANKCVSEKYALIYAKAYALDISVVRLSNIFGQRASIHSSNFTFNNYFIGLALQNKPITIFGDGLQKRNVLYVDDAVSALIKIAQNETTKGETFFAVSDYHYSVAEIAEATVKCFEKGSIEYIPWPPGKRNVDVGHAILSNEKIKKAVNWEPRYSLEQGMLITKEYFNKNLQHYLRKKK